MPRNEVFGWVWILAGLSSGLGLGLFFQREDWLGGYASHPRRLIRLGHISFLGLGILNVLFALGSARTLLAPGLLAVASWALIVGAVTMPVSCVLMAWRRQLQPVFAVPVTSLLLGAGLVAFGMLRS
ncbi:MAG: hypothetical protein ACHQ52_04380 [Candidatus Eisenbacteria bacterium]